ncbi:MAG: pteridine reductase, partial [Bacteroidota bacterium]|nr:pteridine reductase [Bacteroidota bacterium]
MTKTALITGAAKRVGKELALHLAAQGWNIAIHYNTS